MLDVLDFVNSRGNLMALARMPPDDKTWHDTKAVMASVIVAGASIFATYYYQVDSETEFARVKCKHGVKGYFV